MLNIHKKYTIINTNISTSQVHILVEYADYSARYLTEFLILLMLSGHFDLFAAIFGVEA